MKKTINYSDGYITNREIVNFALNRQMLCYSIGNANCQAPNNEANKKSIMDSFITEYYFPNLYNCKYRSELIKLIQKHLIDDASYNVELHIKFNIKVKAPYAESTQPYLCLDINREERILDVMRVFQSKGVDTKYILDLINAD